MEKKIDTVLIILGLIVLIAIFLTLPMYFLWNWLMTKIFGLINITIWEALGLTLLSGILFGNSISYRKKL